MQKILVIEDNPTNLELMIYLLTAYGYQTLTAVDGEAGCEAAMNETPALVICDVHLPRLDGYGVLARLKAHPRLRSVPVVAVTALAMVGDRDRMLSAGFDGYIAKPIEPEEFIGHVRLFLGRNPLTQTGLPTPASDHPGTQRAAERFTHTIVAVDNSPANLQFLEAALTGSGFRIVPAHSVMEALQRIEESTPDLIVSDIHMPGLDGFDLIREVRRTTPTRNVPFVFLSSSVWDHDQTRDQALALGASRFIQRPIEPANLAEEIRSVLEA